MRKNGCILLMVLWTILISACVDKDEPWEVPEYEGVNAAGFGFLPENSAEKNVIALQEALDSVRVIYVDQPGIYDLDNVIYLDSDTKIIFGQGVQIRKQRNKNAISPEYVFINRGAYTRTYNENIEIYGLNLICNGLDDNYGKIQGLVGHVSFFFVKDLVIKNFSCVDLLPARFCIQIAEFENIRVENLHIEGKKDGVHLGAGKGFVIRNGKFKTFDDPIALNAHDYDISNPTVGWIEDGLIENCHDLEDVSTTGFFCRILAGSWVDWHPGIKLQKSDIVVNNNRLYRVIAPPDGREYTSYTAPTHEKGYQTIDGINWYMMQNGEIYNAGCRNIHFKNIYLNKTRRAAFSIHFDSDKWSRSYYPGSEAPIQSDITFENIYTDGRITDLISARTPVKNIRFINLNWTKGNIFMGAMDGIDYPVANITMEKTNYAPLEALCVIGHNNRPISLNITNSTVASGKKLCIQGNVDIRSSDIPFQNK